MRKEQKELSLNIMREARNLLTAEQAQEDKSHERAIAITHLETAILWQEKHLADRSK
jgi:hypothetical protein